MPKPNKQHASTDDIISTIKRATGGASWAGALAFPLSLSFICTGMASCYGVGNIWESLMLLLFTICLQGVNLSARALGGIEDAQRERAEYLALKFGKFAAQNRRIDPMTSTAGDARSTMLACIFAVFVALSILIGYAFVSMTAATSSPDRIWIALACIVVLTAVVGLRYLGIWRHGCRPYGLLLVFAIGSLMVTGVFFAMAGQLISVVVYPAIGTGALGCSLASICELGGMEEDSQIGRRTLAIAAGARIGKAAPAVFGILAMLWLVAFPIASGLSPLSLAFTLFYIPWIRDLLALKKAGPAQIARLESSMALSHVFVALAFMFCIAGSNIVSLFW